MGEFPGSPGGTPKLLTSPHFWNFFTGSGMAPLIFFSFKHNNFSLSERESIFPLGLPSRTVFLPAYISLKDGEPVSPRPKVHDCCVVGGHMVICVKPRNLTPFLWLK